MSIASAIGHSLLNILFWCHIDANGTEFWVSCQRLAFLTSHSHLRLIQNSVPSTVVWRQCYIQILNMAVPQSHSLYINQSSIMSGPKFFEWNSFDNCDDPHQKSFRRVHDIACLLDECMNCFLKARICQITPKDLSSKDDLSFYIVGNVIHPKYHI